MKKTYTPLIVGGLVLGGLYLWRKAKAERDPFYQAFKGLYSGPTTIKPGRVWIVWLTDGSTKEMTSAELQEIVNTGKVASYVDKEQL
jgi:hypothetical protein